MNTLKRITSFILICLIPLCAHSINSESVVVSYSDKDSLSYLITISNLSEDTLFLFDTYMKKCGEGMITYDAGYYYESIYMHRYDRRIYTLSFLPIGNCISTSVDGFFTFDFSQILRGLRFSYREIPPHGHIQFDLLKSAFHTTDYIKDYRHEGKYIWIKRPKYKQYKVTAPSVIKVEFAIYEKVDMLLKTVADSSFDYETWVDEFVAYDMISVNIPVE